MKHGPKAYVSFKNGKCEVGRGKRKRPSAKLFFSSPTHLNNMFDGNGNPILHELPKDPWGRGYVLLVADDTEVRRLTR